LKNPSQKGLMEWLKVKALSSSTSTEKQTKKSEFMTGEVTRAVEDLLWKRSPEFKLQVHQKKKKKNQSLVA
jgi:hypothetical protein